MCKYFDLLLYFKQKSILLLILSVFSKLSFLLAPSVINLFFNEFNLSNTTKLILLDSLLQEVTETESQIAFCLIRPSLHCLIHFSKRLMWLKSNLSNTTKLTMLDSLHREVGATEIKIATFLIRQSPYCLIHLSKRLGQLKSKKQLV